MAKGLGLFSRLRVATKLAGDLSEEERGTLSKLIPGHYKTSAYRGVSGMLTAYSRSPWVRAVESKISDAVGGTKWMLFGLKNSKGKFVRNEALQQKGIDTSRFKLGQPDDIEGELVPIIDHPMLRLLNYSNPLFPGMVGRAQTQISLDLTGEAFWLLGPENATDGGQFVPERFWLLPSTWITSMPSPNEPWWEVQTPSWQGKFPEQAILRFVTPNPVNPYGRGSGIFRAFGDEIDTDEYAAQHVKSWFLNKARPDLLITSEGLSESDTKRIETSWLQNLRGFMQAHKPFFIARKVDVHQISQKFSDMELGTLRAWERDIIVHGIGMPPEMLGIVENSNRSTIDAADYLWSRWVLTPRLELQRSFLQWQLVPMYDDRLILGYESPIQEDREYQLNVMKANPVVFTANDWKRQAGVVPTDDGDVYVMKFNDKVVADLTPTAQAVPSVPSVVDSFDPPALPKGVSLPPDLSCEHEHGSEQFKTRGTPRRVPEPYTKQVGGPDTTRLALNLSGQMQAELIEAWHAMSGQIDYRALMEAFASGDLDAAMQVLNAADLSAELEIARQTMREALVVVGQESANELGQFLGVNLSFDLTNPESVAFLQEFGGGMVTDVSDETYDALRRLLVQAYDEGLTAKEVAKLIEGEVGLTERDIKQRQRIINGMREEGMSEAVIQEEMKKWTKAKIKYRAQVIADNELVSAGNHGQRILWDQAVNEGLLDADIKRQWIVTPDEHLCKICEPMAAPQEGISIVGLNEPYSTPVGAVYVPSNIHVRCRCSERLLV